MSRFAISILIGLALTGCTVPPMFVADAPVVQASDHTPDRFELPGRFAVVQSVYGRVAPVSAGSADIWSGVAEEFSELGSFTPLVTTRGLTTSYDYDRMFEAARSQRYSYLLHLQSSPATGTANITLFHVGSGGIMATAQAVSPEGGRRGFWGGRIRNPARLDRVTERLAVAARPVVEEMLQGVAARAE